MDAWLAILLGIVQGLTEFLPISSTAHLRLVPALLGLESGSQPFDPGAAFTAVVQLGTLAAVVVYFAGDLSRIASSTLRAVASREARRAPEARLGLYIVVGTVPIGIAGLLAEDLIVGRARSLWVIAAALIALGVALAAAERFARHERGIGELGLRDALLIGCAQALALVPGASRSGVTLTAALLVGMRREAAARYSFLLSVPAVAAAGVFELGDALAGGAGALAPLALATAAAAVSGYAAIAWLLRFLRTRSTSVFVVYRIALGLLLLWLVGGGRIAP